MKSVKNNTSYLKRQLRSLFLQSRTREVAFKKGRRVENKRVRFKCNVCGLTYQRTSMEVDHIEPVAEKLAKKVGPKSTPGMILSQYVKLLWDAKNLQLLCKSCHSKKTWEDTQE